MNLKPGDRVIFLNEKGGGVITRIVSPEVVHVAIADGFEIPYAVKDLLKEGAADPQQRGASIFSRQQEPEEEDFTPLYSVPNDSHQIAGGVYLAMIPENQDKPLEQALDFFLVNHSPYQVLFSLYLNRSGAYHGLEYGFVDPDSRLLLQKVERTDIEQWANGMIQVIFFKEGKADPIPAGSATLNFRPVKIYKEESFGYQTLLRKKALMVEGVLIDKLLNKEAEEQVTEQNIKFLQEKIATGRPAEQKKKTESFLDKHKVDDKIAEVDLHIGELVENFANLSNADMLNIQMEYVKKCMDQAMSERLSKIIFIHGVGNGTLKNEILRLLRRTSGVEYYDAPYARYGLGATEVSFYRHQ